MPLQKLQRGCMIIILLILTSFQISAQWKSVQTGLEIGNIQAFDASEDSTIVIAASKDGFPSDYRLVVSHDCGKTFNFTTKLYELPDPIKVVNQIEVVDKNHIWIITSTKIFASSDGGKIWQMQFSDTSLTKYLNYIEMFDVNNGVAVGDAKLNTSLPTTVLKTTDGGKSWKQVNEQLLSAWSGDDWRRIDFTDMENGYFYASGITPNQLLKTTDGGRNWKSTTAPIGTQVLKFYDKNYGVNFAYSDAEKSMGIFTTYDGGETWNNFFKIDGGWGIDFEFVPGEHEKIWFTNSNVLFYSADSGKTWTLEPLPYSNISMRNIKFITAKTGWVASNNKIILTTNTNGSISVVDKFDELPLEFALHQNYPNPFNPETTISYKLSAVSNVNLKVYDILGREVATLVNEEQQPGMYNVKFTMNSPLSTFTRHWRASSSLSSAVYFYKLQAGDFVQTKKMLFIK
jgi:photosystem II stability/assembly factor-like uncharacterized protein